MSTRVDVPRVGLAAPADQELGRGVLALGDLATRAPSSRRRARTGRRSRAPPPRAAPGRPAPARAPMSTSCCEPPLRPERREAGLQVGHHRAARVLELDRARRAACPARRLRRRAAPRPSRRGSSRRAPRYRRRGSGARSLRGPALRSPSRTRSRPRAPDGRLVHDGNASGTPAGSSEAPDGRANVQSPARDGTPRHTHPRRRHRPRADGGDAPRARGHRRRVRVGRPARRRRGDGRSRRQPAARVDAGVDPRQRRRAEGADHDPDRRRLPLGQRRAADEPRPLRAGAAVQDLSGRPHPLRGRRPRDRARDDRGHLRGDRVRAGHAGERRADRLARGARRASAAAATRGSRSSRPRSPAPGGSSSSRSTTRAGWAAGRSRPCTRRTS